MRNKETGEFELVVGNGQLLSAFFILVLLLAVTFAMGYVVGQNAPRSAKVQNDAAAPAPRDQRPAAASAAQPEPAPPPQKDTPQEAGDQPAAEAPPQPTTQPARDANAPPPASPAAQNPAPAAPASAASADNAPDTPPGSCWQVLATKEAKTANLLADTLKRQGYPAFVKTGTDGLLRVLVGPYSDVPTMSRVKTELETRFNLMHPIRK